MKIAESGAPAATKDPKTNLGRRAAYIAPAFLVSSTRLDLTHADEPVLAVSSGCSRQALRSSLVRFEWCASLRPVGLRIPGFALRHHRRAWSVSNVGVGRGGHESLVVRRILDIPFHALPERTPYQGRSYLVLCSVCLALLHTPATRFGG